MEFQLGYKMRILLSALLIPFVLFGFDISFNKKFEKQISPNKLTTNITISVLKNSEEKVTPLLNKFNNMISKNDMVEKRAGDFSIRPKYKYNKGQSTIIGYNGTLTYTIYASNAKVINAFVKSIITLKSDNDTSITVSGLNWIISEDKKSEAIEDLRLEAIVWAKQYTSEISSKINSICNIKNINISSQGIRPMFKQARTESMMMSKQMQDSNIPIPQVGKNSISINPHYTLECK